MSNALAHREAPEDESFALPPPPSCPPVFLAGIDEFRMLWLPWATHRKVWHKMEVWTATRAGWPSKRPFCAILFYASPRATKACETRLFHQGKKDHLPPPRTTPNRPVSVSSMITAIIELAGRIDLSHNCARDPEKNRANASVGQKIWARTSNLQSFCIEKQEMASLWTSFFRLQLRWPSHFSAEDCQYVWAVVDIDFFLRFVSRAEIVAFFFCRRRIPNSSTVCSDTFIIRH